MKGNRALGLVATLVVVTILAFSLSLFAFAGGAVFTVPDGTKIVTKDMVPSDTTIVNIPASVVSIESGAFSNCKNLETVNIDNVNGSVVYDASAFYSSAISVNYLKSAGEETVEVTDATPFASAKGQLSGVDIWDNLVDNAGDKETDSKPSTALVSVIIYVATGAALIGAVTLIVSKFKADKNSA